MLTIYFLKYHYFLQVVQKQHVVADMRNMLADHEDRINAMCDHLKNVRQELALTQVASFVIQIVVVHQN
jgi:hypothetical protein